jgi:hypothetical protein
MLQAILSSQPQLIFIPFVVFSKRNVQRGTISQLPGVEVDVAPVMVVVPMPGMPIAVRSIIIVLVIPWSPSEESFPSLPSRKRKFPQEGTYGRASRQDGWIIDRRV